MDQYRRAYLSQKHNARRRGIEFRLSFDQWMTFWGADIDRRGRGECNLQMQRIADAGAYEIGNIKKGTPKQNTATIKKMAQTRASLAAAEELQLALDRAMLEESAAADDEITEDEHELSALGYSSSFDRRYCFAADFDR